MNGHPAGPGAMTLWLADLVCPVESPPIRGGAVLTSGGRVLAVGERGFVRPPDGAAHVHDFGRAVLIPGMVNAHAHLELSGLERPPAPMAEWIVGLVRELRAWPPHLFLASARIGTAASLAAGVTCVGDVSASGASTAAIADAGMRGVVFHEVLGLDPERADAILRERLERLEAPPEMRGGLAGAVRYGLSPHAPYSTSPALYRAALAEARARGWPAATHLAESPEEAAFIRGGGGPFAAMHRALESPAELFRPSGLSPAAHLAAAGALEGLALAVHCNQTGGEDWALLRRAGVGVCLCPRSAAFFGHPSADVAGLRRAGLALCLGTDSRASSPSLSLREEAAALRGVDPDLSAADLLRMCTRAGAEALGLADAGVGLITPGGVADFAAVEVSGDGTEETSLDALFAPGAAVRCTVTGGEVRFGG